MYKTINIVGGCWKSKKSLTDDVKLFGTIDGGFEDAILSLNVENIFKLILYSIVFISLLLLFVNYTYLTILDCKKTVKNEWYVCLMI